MEQIARDAFTPRVKQEILSAIKIRPEELEDLGGFESFVFTRPAKKSILRITHLSHRDIESIMGELEFIRHLAGQGASVCNPIAFEDGSFARQIDEFVVCQFEQARGDLVAEADWGPDLFHHWGRCIAGFHLAATHFNPEHRRMDWRADENLNFRARIPAAETLVLKQADDCLRQIGLLATSEDTYGVIHCDAHPGNFFLEDGNLAFFDFDDCCYQWFVFDVATIMFSAVLQPWLEDSQPAREAQASTFLKHFFEGYDQVFPVSAFLLEQMPLFLKARELSLYAVIHAHMDVNNLQDWFAIKFMQDRQTRIEAGAQVLDLDFSSL